MPAHQKLLANAVMLLGGESRFAINGREALRLARTEPFDIILLDLRMPELGGIAAASHLLDHWKDLERRPRILVITGESPEDTCPLCHAVGVDGYISKPYTMTLLRHCLMLLVTQGHCWSDGPAPRLLDVARITRAMTERDEASLAEALQEARASLLALCTQRAGMGMDEVTSRMEALSAFAERYGFLQLHDDLRALLAAPARSSLSTAMASFPWPRVQDEFEAACRAAVSWYRQPQLSESLAA